MKLFIDCDPGIDDIFALVYLLTRPDIDIVGIGSVAGNVNIKKVNRNLHFIVSLLNPNVKIFKGPGINIIENDENANPRNAESYHGPDGVGNFWISNYYKENAEKIREIMEKYKCSNKHAVLELINLSHQYSGELVVLALGPLTNIALAQLIDPLFDSRLRKIFIMGGSFKGTGNSDFYEGSEFNFSIDPESVQIVLSRFKCPKFIYAIDTLGSPPFKREFLLNWSKNEMLQQFLTICFNYVNSRHSRNVFYDLIAAIIMMHPETIKTVTEKRFIIELCDSKRRGSMRVIESTEKTENYSHQRYADVFLIEEIDEQKITKIMSNL